MIRHYSKYSLIRTLTFIAGKVFLLEKFIGINLSKDNINKIVRARKVLEKQIDKYYRHKIPNKEKPQDKYKILEPDDQGKVVLASEYVDKLRYKHKTSTKRGFRSKSMRKFLENIIIIQKMAFEDNRSVGYICKWLRISPTELSK